MSQAVHTTVSRDHEQRRDVSVRLDALAELLDLGSGRLDESLLADGSALLERAGERLRLSGDHTVVALAGGTGSGKSSLFNAVSDIELSQAGVIRPTTAATHACVWGLSGAGPLLDWLGIPKRHRHARASALDAGEPSALQGLVLLDLPDHDSIRDAHRIEVERLVELVDLFVWVLDPQKYADAAIHERYLRPLAGHDSVTAVVLNQTDRLTDAEAKDCADHLYELLEAYGITTPEVLRTSATTGAGVGDLRALLAETVASRRSATDRIAADIDGLCERFEPYCGSRATPEIAVDDADILVDHLADAAGVPAAASRIEEAHMERSVSFLAWPLSRAARRLRRDPLRRMRLTDLREELRRPAASPVTAQQATVDEAVHGVIERGVDGLPQVWADAVRGTARGHVDELPEALHEALAGTVPTQHKTPPWWWVAAVFQHMLIAVAVAGLAWLVGLVLGVYSGLGEPPIALFAEPGLLPYPLVMMVGAMLLGWATSAAARTSVRSRAGHRRQRVEGLMRERVVAVARAKVLAPVERELARHAGFCEELQSARSRR